MQHPIDLLGLSIRREQAAIFLLRGCVQALAVPQRIVGVEGDGVESGHVRQNGFRAKYKSKSARRQLSLFALHLALML